MVNEIREIIEFQKSIDGYLSDDEGILLYNLAKEVPKDLAIVEIGSWKGKSTIWLAKGALAGNSAKVHAIDPFDGASEHKAAFGKFSNLEIFLENIKNAGVASQVEHFVGESVNIVKKFNKKVGLIFIDGAHEYEYVKLDYDVWHPKVVFNGVMAFHDTKGDFKGPKIVVKNTMFFSKTFKKVKCLGSITYGVKVIKITATESLMNKFNYFIKIVTENMRVIKLPFWMRRILMSPVRMIQK